MSTNSSGVTSGITIPTLVAKKKKNEKIVMLTAYDYPTSRILAFSGIDIILVGDSLGNVILGYENTIPVSMSDMLHHTKAVTRATNKIPVIADMPFLSYQISSEEGVRNAGKFVQEAGASGVKLEGASPQRIETIKRIIDTGIPVMGHIGLTPQSIRLLGGFKPQGKRAESAFRLIQEAKELEKAGAFSIVIENTPEEVASIITSTISIPTIGIGAGAGCDGQVLVINDILGFGGDFLPPFVRQYTNIGEQISDAVKQFAKDVRTGKFPSEKETNKISPDELKKLDKLLK